MALDPKLAAFLASPVGQIPPSGQLSAAQLREALKQVPAPVLNPPVHAVRNLKVPGPQGEIDVRLYLPRCWLQDPARLDAAGVPDSCRHYLTRPALALELLDAALAAGVGASALAVAAGWSLPGISRGRWRGAGWHSCRSCRQVWRRRWRGWG